MGKWGIEWEYGGAQSTFLPSPKKYQKKIGICITKCLFRNGELTWLIYVFYVSSISIII